MRANTLATLAIFIFAATSSFAQVVKPSAKQNPAQEFAHAKALIENNCIDCEGGTQASMELGISEMKTAIAAGYPDKVAAYKLLDDAYSAMDTYTEKNLQQHAVYASERAQSMNVLYKLAPNDAEVLETYAENYAHDDAEKARLYKRIVELDPKRTGARYMLGLLTAKGDAAEGMRFIEQAIVEEKNDEATITYVQGLTELMRTHGCGFPDTKTWLDKASAAYDKATNGAGDPKVMPEFKQQFLAAVRQQHCANAMPK